MRTSSSTLGLCTVRYTKYWFLVDVRSALIYQTALAGEQKQIAKIKKKTKMNQINLESRSDTGR
jgi:hypothetical protein